MIILPMSYILLSCPCVYLKSRVLDLNPVFMKHWHLAKMINSHWVGSGIPKLAAGTIGIPPFRRSPSLYTGFSLTLLRFPPSLPSCGFVMIILPVSYMY